MAGKLNPRLAIVIRRGTKSIGGTNISEQIKLQQRIYIEKDLRFPEKTELPDTNSPQYQNN